MTNKWESNGNNERLYFILFYLDSKIIAGADCSLEIKRLLLLGRKAMTNIGIILEYIGIILSTKVHLAKAMVFPVVIYGGESWAIMEAEH